MAYSAPMSTTQAADTLNLAIQKMWVKKSEPENQYSKYFNVRTGADYYEKDSGLSGLSEADYVDENGVIVSDVPVQTFDQTYTQNVVAIVTSFTLLMWKFGIKKRDLMGAVNDLRNAILRKKEKLCAERLTNGWATSYTHTGIGRNTTVTTTGGDGVCAFSASHTREDGGTNMNNVVYDGTTYNLPFDYAGLKAAHRTASLFVDPRGNPMPANLDTLVCKKGSSVHFKAMEILGAIKSGKIPESTDNDGAGVPAFKILPLDYLTQDAYWFMFDSSRKGDKSGFQFVESEGSKLDDPNVIYKTGEIQFKATAIFDLGHNDVARMWVGSNGTES